MTTLLLLAVVATAGLDCPAKPEVPAWAQGLGFRDSFYKTLAAQGRVPEAPADVEWLSQIPTPGWQELLTAVRAEDEQAAALAVLVFLQAGLLDLGHEDRERQRVAAGTVRFFLPGVISVRGAACTKLALPGLVPSLRRAAAWSDDADAALSLLGETITDGEVCTAGSEGGLVVRIVDDLDALVPLALVEVSARHGALLSQEASTGLARFVLAVGEYDVRAHLDGLRDGLAKARVSDECVSFLTLRLRFAH